MKAVLSIALIGLLLVLCGWPLIRADAASPNDGRALIGYTLGLLGVVFIFIAAAACSALKGTP